MIEAPRIERGCIFGAEHDASFEGWISQQPRWKLCLAFNAVPPAHSDEVLYFIATSGVSYFRENHQLADDVLILPPNSYSFLPKETALDFRGLCVVSFAKLLGKKFELLGRLNDGDLKRCEQRIRSAWVLEPRMKRRLGLL